MLSWDTNAGGLSLARRSPSLVGSGSRWSPWQLRLWRELSCGVIPYAVAHTLFWLHSLRGDVTSGGLDLVVAQLLFLLGTLLLWRVTRTLHEPPASEPVGDPQAAASCLAVTVGLAFSPGVWWLISLT